ncbi:hypothetical protein K378_02796 [Streptomyces sp. Amel2xB2]|uniref:hypothetical protein n=1 Tax=Streptomyces sp. Amel2xB2 TaxID=1305829 RepID=UPI000DB9B8A7|nr:hypothetical protein [Streptomyces sp. Amel2xB2]RAJ66624.1 hypothetical protein K378_02796 [Streptomyces sp. Amel2xB2]
MTDESRRPEENQPPGWTDPRYVDVVARISAHAAMSGHRPRRHGFPFNGVRGFVVPGAEGHKRVTCCTCLHPA